MSRSLRLFVLLLVLLLAGGLALFQPHRRGVLRRPRLLDVGVS